MTDDAVVVAAIDPQSTTTTLTSDWVDMRDYHRVRFTISAGALAGDLNGIIQESADSTGGTPTTVTGKAITALDATADNNKQAEIVVDGSEVTKRYVACKLSADGTNACLVSCVGYGYRRNTGSADLASVDEIVN